MGRLARYRQIEEELRAQIHSGALRPGDRLPTEHELAAQYGVSRVTSRAALTGLAHEGLVQRVPRRGTIVAAAAQSCGPARPLIGWIQSDIDPAFSAGLLRGGERAARQAGYNLLLHLTGASLAEEERAIREALAAGVSALALFLQDGEKYNDEVLRLVLNRFPLVLMDRFLRGVECAGVQSDNVAGARAIVGELLAAGHRNICALLYPPSHTSTIEDRLEGYAQELAAAGIPLHRSLLYVEDGLIQLPAAWLIPDAIIERLAAFLRRKSEVTAIFATNAGLALLALYAAERLGLRVPDDLSIVSIDAVECLPLTVPALTCMLQQEEEIGATAIALLREQLSGGPPRRVILPMQVRRAGSVAAPRLVAHSRAGVGD